MESESMTRVQLYEIYIDAISQHLNEVHREAQSSRYWEQLIGPWLMSFIWYLAYRFESSKPLNTFRTYQKEPFPIPYDYLSFNYLFEQGTYPQQLDTLINGGCELESFNDWYCSYFQPLQWKGKNWLRKPIAWLSRYWVRYARVVMVSPYCSIEDQLRIVLRSRFSILPLFFFDSHSPGRSINFSLRGWSHERKHFSTPLDELLYRIVLMQLPYVYLEGYQHLKNQLPIGLKRLQAIFSSTGWWQEEGHKLLAAQKQQQGVLRIGMQHGGNPYGTGDSYSVKLEKSLVDYFLTWGWKYHKGDIPFLAFKFSIEREKIHAIIPAEKNDILYISTSGSRYFPDEFGMPSGEQFEESYFADQCRFIMELKASHRKEMVFRLHPRGYFYGWDHQQRLQLLDMEFRFDNSLPLLEAVLRAKLVVCDNFYTTFTQSLIYGVPTILFINRDMWSLNSEFIKLFQQMEEVGIAHCSTTSAAHHIERVGDAPERWWNSPEVIKMREAYLEEYGKVASNPVNKLVEVINKIISDNHQEDNIPDNMRKAL